MTHFLQIGIATSLLLASGFLHGIHSERWGSPEALANAAKALDRIPAQFGSWVSEEVPVPKPQLEIAEAVSHYSRHFVNQADGTVVNVMILCGRPGPIAVHPPTVCFTGAGLQQLVPEAATTVGPAEQPLGEFFRVDFGKEEAGVPVRLRTWWGWSTDGDWQAAATPRREFAGESHLYKIYFTRPLSSLNEPTADDPAEEFMRVFLPKVRAALEPSAG
jgi:hypothetical protein